MSNQSTHKVLAFLHTSKVHIATFDNLLLALSPDRASTFSVIHKVDESLLTQATKHGQTSALTKAVNTQMQLLEEQEADVIVCTCSSIGAIVEQFDMNSTANCMRIDRAMADQGVSTGDKILVLAALETTLTPTYDLINESARACDLQVNITLQQVAGAWLLFEQGDLHQYSQCIAQAIMKHTDQYDVIILAQASMAGALQYCANVKTPILASPELGLDAALSALNKVGS